MGLSVEELVGALFLFLLLFFSSAFSIYWRSSAARRVTPETGECKATCHKQSSCITSVIIIYSDWSKKGGGRKEEEVKR